MQERPGSFRLDPISIDGRPGRDGGRVVKQRMTATTQIVSQVNRTVILDALRTSGALSRQGIIAETGLSSATVNRLVDILKQDRLVIDGALEPSNGGRPRQLLEFNARARSVLVLALGREGVSGAVADLAGGIIRREERPAPEGLRGGRQLIDEIVDFASELADQARAEGAPPRALAVGVPGVTTGEEGLVEFAPALGWSSVPLGARLSDALGIPVRIENDVNLVAIAAHRQQSDPSSHLVALVADIGVGAGLILDGRLHRGRLGAAGEVGYLLMENGSLDRPWPGFGDLESRAGIDGITQRMTAAGLEGDGPPVARVEALFAQARTGTPAAVGLVREIADDFSLVVADIAVLLSPDVLALGGRTFELGGDLLVPAIRSRLEGRIPLVPRLYVSDSAELQLLGGAALALDASANDAVIVR